jgi:hypothetical protein
LSLTTSPTSRLYSASSFGAISEALLTKPIDFAALRSEIDGRVGSAG